MLRSQQQECRNDYTKRPCIEKYGCEKKANKSCGQNRMGNLAFLTVHHELTIY